MPEHFLPRSSMISRKTADALAKAPRTLALISLGAARGSEDAGSPRIHPGLEMLAGPPVQAWHAAKPVAHGRLGRFTTHTTPGFAMITTTMADPADPEAGGHELYSGLLDTARRLERPHFLRIWQYLPRVNSPFREEDRYQAFCAGRHRALKTAGYKPEELPAACLLGDNNDKILLYALISDRAGRQVENPRQQSAFDYPSQYGRTAPSFSRATAARNGSSEHLFISGTSSITGHVSRHTETLDQLEETLNNLDALVAHWDPKAGGLGAIAPMKVYLRHAGDLEAVRAALSKRLPSGHPVTYLRADVCRRELNVEIEGLVQAGAPAPGR